MQMTLLGDHYGGWAAENGNTLPRKDKDMRIGNCAPGLVVGMLLASGYDAGPQTPSSVRPILECVLDHEDGTFSAFFGYFNGNDMNVTIPVGTDNRFSPAPQDRGQPIMFESGRSPFYPDAAFHILWDGVGNVVWTLTGPDGQTRTATAGQDSPLCTEKLPDGTACSVDAQCSSGSCENRSCAPSLHVDVAIIRAESTLQSCDSSTCFTTVAVHDLNGAPGLQCPGCASGSYEFEDFVDVWALMYSGLHHDGTVDCNSDVRWTVAGSGHPDAGYETDNSTDPSSYWEYFFDTCPDEVCGSHQHLWRSPDSAPVTALFQELTGIDTFCNGTQYQDLDPIRRPCYENGSFMEDVCRPDGTLGLLLPIAVPPNYTANNNPCASGHFVWREASFGYSPFCEDGANSVFGLCLVPVDENGDAGCISSSTNFAMFTPLVSDTRGFNRVLRNPDGTVVVDEAGMDVSNAFFRMHETHTATPGATLCREGTTGAQMDCLIQASACSTGHAMKGAHHPMGTTELPLCDGAVIIDIEINLCPEITYLTASPLGIGVADTSEVMATVADGDGDPLTHLWTATSGTFIDPTSLATTYTCVETGSHTITFTVRDPEGCSDAKHIPLTCN